MQENFQAKMGADIRDFMSKMKQVDQEIKNTATEATKPINADIFSFINNMAKASAEAEAFKQPVEKKIEADTAQFLRKMAQAEVVARALNRQYQGTSNEARRMSSEMRTAFAKQSAGMRSLQDELIKAEYGYFKLAQSAKTYTGTNQQFMVEVAKMGAAHKKATDNMLKNNELMKISMIQTAGQMLNMSTQAEKISANYDGMKNPLLQINKGGLAVADSLNKMANAGNASVLALKMLGPTANMKELNDMTRMITQGMMRFQMVAIGAAMTSALVYSALHKGAMDTVKGYEESFGRMKATIREALQPMVDVFGAVMMKIYEFITAIAQMVIRFNEAHPVLAKIIQGIMMLIPALTLLLSPLAVGIGLFGGLAAAWASLWPMIAPIVTGLAAMSATVWIVAAAIVGLTAGIIYLWNTNEGFRNAVIASWNAIKAAAIAAWGFISPYINQAITAVSTFVKAKLDQIKAFWDANGQQVIQALTNIWSVIKGIFSAAMAVIIPILGVAWEIIKAVVISTWNAIKSIINGALNVIQGIIKVFAGIFTGDFSKIWEGVKQIFKGALQILWGWINLYFIGKFLGPLKGFASSAKGIITGAWNVIKGIFTSTLNTIKSLVTGSFNAVNRSISTVMNAIKQVITSIWNSIRSTINTVTSTIKSIVSRAFNSLKQTVSTAMNNVKTAIVNGWNAAKSFLSSINLSSIGKNIIQGLINGIKSMVGAVGSAISEVAGNIKSKIKGALGIHSPSRWMRDMIGKNIPLGMAIGIEKTQGYVAKAAEGLAQAAMIEPKRTEFAFDTSVSNADFGRIRHEFGAEVSDFEMKDPVINVYNEWDGEKVVSYVERGNAKRSRITDGFYGK